MNGRQGSAPEAIGQAIDHIRTMLFRPFEPGRWVMLGFIAFLAYLGEGFTFNFSDAWDGDTWLGSACRSAVAWMMEHRLETAVILFFTFLFILVLGVLFQWLSSRGTFVYIDCLATNRAELARPWREHRAQADSYFFWRLVFGLCSLFVNLLLALPFILSFVSALSSGEDADILKILFGGGLGLLTLPILALAVIVEIFVGVTLRDFVAPVQYLRKIKTGPAFGIVIGLMMSAPGAFIVYFLLKILLLIVAIVGITIVGCATCCVAFCCFALPFVGQTVLQPLYVFTRSYSLFFLAGFGPEFDVFGPGAPGGGLRGPQAPPPASSWAATPWPQAPGAPGREPSAAWPGTPSGAPPAEPPESVPLSTWPEPQPYTTTTPPALPPAEPYVDPEGVPSEPPAEPPPPDYRDPDKDRGPR